MNAMMLVGLLPALIGQADGSPQKVDGSKDERELAKVLRPFYLREAAEYEFSLDNERKQKLELQRKPVVSWTSEGWSGDVFVWTREGRPEIIGCIGSGPMPNDRRYVFHEFHSLAFNPLPLVRIGSSRTWSPSAAGVELRLLEGAPTPAENAAARLTQMRNLSRQFTASMKGGSGEGVLRLLPQPVYRYESPKTGVVDGAIFGYVATTGTDPELLLLLECRRADSAPRWHYAPVRFTWRELWLEHDDKEVWRVGEHDETWRTTELKQPYCTVPVKNVPLSDLKETIEANPKEARP